MIDVACAIIINERKEILVTQRSASMKLSLKWEFPGGKIEKDESAEACLIREIKEELDINIIIKQALKPNEYHYNDFSIRLIPFICEITSGEIKLTEHAAYIWLQKDKLGELDWAEADISTAQYLISL
ncbi:MAG: (deoxy)nucleoside triphosphate pyrophosphohydrolase [Pedobacter sp.]|nr:(deoxy)nucleoside triphosphate pyrophosphohydrolase [Pedobacter sp.]MDQ8052449.1 (deoxy)nucleoside triphosphate pyrophosphohydrolase [Pedobacter sp.]